MVADATSKSEVADATVRVQADDFNQADEIRLLTQGNTDIGAVATFTGLCRSEGESLNALELEHYPGMAEAEIERCAADACKRWPIDGMTVIHRYGVTKVAVKDQKLTTLSSGAGCL